MLLYRYKQRELTKKKMNIRNLKIEDRALTEAIKKLQRKNGKAPSIGDIARAIGLTPQAVYLRMKRLEASGAIRLQKLFIFN